MVKGKRTIVRRNSKEDLSKTDFDSESNLNESSGKNFNEKNANEAEMDFIKENFKELENQIIIIKKKFGDKRLGDKGEVAQKTLIYEKDTKIVVRKPFYGRIISNLDLKYLV